MQKQPNRKGCDVAPCLIENQGKFVMLMFSRNLSRVEGKGRDGRPLAETETRAPSMVNRRGGLVSKEEEEETMNTSGSFFSRSTARASLKKSRPHSWHSTLQVISFFIININIIHTIIIQSIILIIIMAARATEGKEQKQRKGEGKI